MNETVENIYRVRYAGSVNVRDLMSEMDFKSFSKEFSICFSPTVLSIFIVYRQGVSIRFTHNHEDDR